MIDINKIENPYSNDEYKWTNNNKIYNQHHKQKNAYYSYCSWNRNENFKGNWYGGSFNPSNTKSPKLRHPNWKLAAKVKKQWQAKEHIRKVEKPSLWVIGNCLIEFKFKKGQNIDRYIF